MLKQNPSIMYVGSVETGRQLMSAAQNLGWHFYFPGETMEALSTYIFYYPDVVVIDSATMPITATEIAFHLRSLGETAPILEVKNVDAVTLIDQIATAMTDTTTTTIGGD